MKITYFICLRLIDLLVRYISVCVCVGGWVWVCEREILHRQTQTVRQTCTHTQRERERERERMMDRKKIDQHTRSGHTSTQTDRCIQLRPMLL